MATVRLLGSLLASAAYAQVIGARIRWHAWRSRRATGVRGAQHVAALVRLAALSQRQADRWSEVAG